MKSPWIVVLVVVASCGLAAGMMWHRESMRAAALAEVVAKMEKENARESRVAAEAGEKSKALESESEQLRAMSGPRLEPEPAETPAPQEKPKGKGAMLAKMFKDPEMRKMLVAQQAAMMRGFYSDFVKEARLTPDEADKFFQLIEDRQMALMDSSANLMSGGPVDMKAATAATDTANDALKELLGPDRYGIYRDFEKTLGDRIQVQQFSQQLGAVGAPLEDNQTQSLIAIMSQERASMPGIQPGNSGGMANMTPEQMDEYSKQVDAMNQRVYNRALSVLTPSQLSAFATYQKNMTNAQMAGLKMTQQMLQGQ
jgi:hypothetical protein